MGLLKGSSIYFCGPIDREEDLGVQWRGDISVFLKRLGIHVFDPTNKPTESGFEYNHEYRQQLILENKLDELAKLMREIRCVDLRMVDKSDALICNYDMSVHTCGTLEEIFTANKQKKPVLFYFDGGKYSVPYWLWGVFPHEFFFYSWDSMKEYLCNVNAGYPCHKRWIFFDWSKV